MYINTWRRHYLCTTSCIARSRQCLKIRNIITGWANRLPWKL